MVTAGDRSLQMGSSWTKRAFDVHEGGVLVGRIAQSSILGRTVTAEIPASVPLAVRLLFVFTVLCIQKQRRAAAAS